MGISHIYSALAFKITLPLEKKSKGRNKGTGVGEPTMGTGAKYNILKEIEKRNKLEEKIKEQIEAF